MCNGLMRSRLAVFVLAGIVGFVAWRLLPPATLNASATDRQESLIIATGMLEDGNEAIYVLDSLTGELRGSALSPRTGKFSAAFQTNVVSDMKIDIAKNPRFLLVTGDGSLQRMPSAGNYNVGEAIVYVAELTTGQLGAYATPRQHGQLAGGRFTGGKFIPLDIWAFRQAIVRNAQ